MSWWIGLSNKVFRCDSISRFGVWVSVIIKPNSFRNQYKMLSYLLDFWSCFCKVQLLYTNPWLTSNNDGCELSENLLVRNVEETDILLSGGPNREQTLNIFSDQTLNIFYFFTFFTLFFISSIQLHTLCFLQSKCTTI